MDAPVIRPGIYRHSKTGRSYRVHFLARHSETLEPLVVYEALYDNDVAKFWVRPAAMFEAVIDVHGERVPRFAFVRDA